jgi:hypothetical protein
VGQTRRGKTLGRKDREVLREVRSVAGESKQGKETMPPVQIPRTDGGEKSSMKDIYKELFKEFDKKFVRDDGLMDKYTSDEDGDTIELAEGIKQFIRERTIPIKVSREGQAQVFWQIDEIEGTETIPCTISYTLPDKKK